MDLFLFNQINQYVAKWAWLDVLGVFFAKYFEYFLIFLLLLYLAKHFQKYWPIVVKALISAFLARFFIVNLIRLFWPRVRPFVENNVNLLLGHKATPSFPSGHAAFYFAISTVVYSYNKKLGIFFFVSSFLIVLARVFCGLHWPSDILAGAIVGIFSGWMVLFISREFFFYQKK